jgi:putative ABC transport system permease protein
MRLVLWRGVTLIAIGLSIGLIVSLRLTRFLASLLYEVRPTDLETCIVVAFILAAVALLANFLPARRASRVDPMVALRCE